MRGVRMLFRSALFAAGLAVSGGSAVASDAVAMITDLKGGASLLEHGKPNKLGMLAYLVPDTEIQLDAGAKLVVTYFAKPVEYAFNGPAKVVIKADGAQAKVGTAETRKLGQEMMAAARKFSASQREKLAQATFEMRGVLQPGLRLLDPVDTDVLTATPDFRWAAPPGVQKQRLVISQNGQVIHSLSVEGNAWRLPKKAPLANGKTYQWKVEAELPSGEALAATGSFTMVDKAKAVRFAHAKPGPGAPFSDRVLYAAMLENEGLRFEARAEWNTLAHERPDEPALQERAVR